MKIKMNDENPGTWFNFNNEKPEDGGICIRAMSPAVLSQIEKKNSKKMAEYRAPISADGKQLPAQRFEWVEYDEDGLFADRWDYCIVDWRNLTDDENNPIPCTRENKIKLVSEQVNFSVFVIKCMTHLRKSIEEEMEKNLKNLLGTSKAISGTSTAAIAEQSTPEKSQA